MNKNSSALSAGMKNLGLVQRKTVAAKTPQMVFGGPGKLVLSQPRNRKGLEAKGRTDGLVRSLRKSVWVIVIWRLTEY